MQIQKEATKSGEAMKEAMRSLSGEVLSLSLHQEITLPIKAEDPKVPHFGAFLREEKLTSALVYSQE